MVPQVCVCTFKKFWLLTALTVPHLKYDLYCFYAEVLSLSFHFQLEWLTFEKNILVLQNSTFSKIIYVYRIPFLFLGKNVVWLKWLSMKEQELLRLFRKCWRSTPVRVAIIHFCSLSGLCSDNTTIKCGKTEEDSSIKNKCSTKTY